MVIEQLIKWAESWVLDMIQLEMKTMEICISIYKGGDAVIVLDRSLSIKYKVSLGVELTFGSTPNS